MCLGVRRLKLITHDDCVLPRRSRNAELAFYIVNVLARRMDLVMMELDLPPMCPVGKHGMSE